MYKQFSAGKEEKMKRNIISTSIIVILQLTMVIPANAVTLMPITDVPLDVALNRANSVFVIDDSASMDFELILNNYDDGDFIS